MERPSVDSRSKDIRRLLLSASLAGLGMAILGRIPVLNTLNLLCCGWIWLGSIFAAWHFNYLGAGEEGQERNILLPQGVAAGSLAGIIAALVGGVLFYYFLGAVGVDSLISATAQLMGVEENLVWDSLPNLGLSKNALLTLTDLAINLLVYPIIGAIGGGVGTLLFGPRPTEHIAG